MAARTSAWKKTARGAADQSELRTALSELGATWKYNSSDPRLYDEFLISKGIDKRRTALTQSQESQLRSEFGKLVAARLEASVELINGALRCDVRQTLTRSREFSGELKALVYRCALGFAEEETLALTLSYLSEDNAELSRSMYEYIPHGPLAVLFRRFLQGERNPLVPSDLSHAPTEAAPHLEFVLSLTNSKNDELSQNIEQLDPELKPRLAELCRHYISVLPREGFGQYLAARSAMYLCLQDRAESVWNDLKHLLGPYASRDLADYVALLGKRAIAVSLRAMPDKFEGALDEYAATLIDYLRSMGSLEIIESDVKRLRRAGYLTGFALAYSEVSSKQSERKQFAKEISTGLKRDRQGRLFAWIVRNPPVLDFLSYRSLNARLVTGLANAASEEGERSVNALIQWVLKSREANADKLTLAVLKYISETPRHVGHVSDLFRHVISTRPLALGELLRSQPLRQAILQQLLSIAPGLSNETCDALIAAIRPIPAETGKSLLRSAFSSDLRHWAIDNLVPVLLEDDCISGAELAAFRDPSVAPVLIAKLTELWRRNATKLNRYEADWRSRRDDQKRNIARRLHSSLANVLATAAPDLRSRAARIADVLDAWITEDSPSYKSVSNSVWSFADDLPDDIDLRRVSSGSDLVNAISLRPEMIAQMRESTTERLPSIFSALEVIAREYAVSAKAWARASKEVALLKEATLMDLAVRVRQGLEDIEVGLTPYFLFRSALREVGLDSVAATLGDVIQDTDLSSRVHKVHRESDKPGLLHNFSMGLQVGKDIVGSVVVMKSGDSSDSH